MWISHDAKRLECVQLAGAFVRRGRLESGSKLHALQTLRAVRLRLAALCSFAATRAPAFRISAFGFPSDFGLRISDLKLLPALAALLWSASAAFAQVTTPHIGYVYPAGGRQSTTFQVAVGGQFLDGATNVHVSGAGVRASLVSFAKPLTPQQANQLREKMQQLQEKRQAANQGFRKRDAPTGSQTSTNATWTAADQQQLMEIRRKLAGFQRRPANPAIAETVTLQITVNPEAEPGEREIRIGTQLGLSNPLLFCVGQLPEFSKKNPKLEDEPGNFRPARNNNEQKATPPTEMNITLPAVVNGQILQGGVDRYRFQGRKGQRLVVAACARELIPYLPDAVPGWFQAALALYDSKGHELAYADHYRFHPDPVLYCELLRDGEYVAEIRDSIYRGRDDFVYRITVGEVPYITSIFPLGGQAKSTTTVQLNGWNLPTNTVIRTNQEPGIYSLSVSTEARLANRVPFAVDTLPEILEQEPNDLPAAAQPVILPVIINGRIDKPGDWDVFRFEGRAGDEVVAEVYARRLDSPLDSVLKLTDETGKQLAFNDDNEDKGAGLNTHYADSWLHTTLPATGSYYLHIGDSQRQGGPEYGYRLRISPPRPDFALRVVPSSVNVRGGMRVPLTVYALRRDGFSNEIAVVLKDAPPGFTLDGALVPAGQNQVRLTLSAPPRPTLDPISVSLEGQATIQGKQVIHPAVPAEDMMQAFAYRHLVPAKELDVAVSGRFMGRGGLKLLDSTPVRIPVGGTAHVRVGTPSGGFGNRFQLELNEPPEGITIAKVSPTDEGTEIELHSDAAKAKAGLKGNLIVNILPVQGLAAAQKAKKQNNQRRPIVGTLPAIPFEIVRASGK